jgi:hypothetical protein
MPLEKDKIGLILLGASTFPSAPKFAGSVAFLHSKEKIKEHFTRKYELSEPNTILDLFDSEASADATDQAISDFIEKNSAVWEDLVVYYVGHGSFHNGFLLTIQASRARNLAVSSITAQALCNTLTIAARNKRIFVVLDCCFAANIYLSFQSPLDDVIRAELENYLPANGLALLCASSKDKPARIVSDREITMFTESLDLVLNKGSKDIKAPFLSFRQVSNLTHSFIRGMNKEETVRPEVHTPIMPQGDIADIPHFTNYSYKPEGIDHAYSITARMDELTQAIVSNNLLFSARLFLDFVGDFDKSKQWMVEATLLTAECNELEESKPSKESDAYNSYKTKRQSLYRRILEMVYTIYNSPKVNLN